MQAWDLNFSEQQFYRTPVRKYIYRLWSLWSKKFLLGKLFLIYLRKWYQKDNFQKQPPRGVLMKKCSENMRQIYRRTPMLKCDFNKVALQAYWNNTSLGVFSCKLILTLTVTWNMKCDRLQKQSPGDVLWKRFCLRPATLLKKRLGHRCFLWIFAKFLRTPFLSYFATLLKSQLGMGVLL